MGLGAGVRARGTAWFRRGGGISAEEVVPVAADLSVADPHLRWPRGLGPQPLYALRVDWYPGTDGACPPSPDGRVAPRSSVTHKIGLRRVLLVRERRGSTGSARGGKERREIHGENEAAVVEEVVVDGESGEEGAGRIYGDYGGEAVGMPRHVGAEGEPIRRSVGTGGKRLAQGAAGKSVAKDG